jgi:hypothetical protein
MEWRNLTPTPLQRRGNSKNEAEIKANEDFVITTNPNGVHFE